MHLIYVYHYYENSKWVIWCMALCAAQVQNKSMAWARRRGRVCSVLSKLVQCIAHTIRLFNLQSCCGSLACAAIKRHLKIDFPLNWLRDFSARCEKGGKKARFFSLSASAFFPTVPFAMVLKQREPEREILIKKPQISENEKRFRFDKSAFYFII